MDVFSLVVTVVNGNARVYRGMEKFKQMLQR